MSLRDLLYSLDYPIAQNGVMIMIGSYKLMVKDACSGINSIFALSAIGIFYVHEFVNNNWIRRVILIASIIPITILATSSGSSCSSWEPTISGLTGSRSVRPFDRHFALRLRARTVLPPRWRDYRRRLHHAEGVVVLVSGSPPA